MCDITSIGSLSRALLCVLVISVLSPAAAGIHKGSPASCGDHACDHGDGETASNRVLVPIARLMYSAMPPGERAKLRAAGALGAPDDGALASGSRPERGDARRWLERRLDTLNDGSFTADQRDALRSIADAVDEGRGVPMMCFAPGTDPEYASMMNALLYAPNPIAFQQADRWGRTALSGPGLQQGDPTTITYSFVPDGTVIPSEFTGFPDGNSILFIWLNSIYDSPSNWQPLFDQVFDRWSELIGTDYVHEPNDDGLALAPSNLGIQGVRGDVRIAAFPVDGNSGILAFNFFPQFGGDMVFDAFDSFYDETSNNSLRFRNVAAHEHGHGLGMFHVCPVSQTILMEPFATTAFDGPQLDDTLNGQRHYGDPLEPNDGASDATDLGALGVDDTISAEAVSVDDALDDEDWFSFELTEPARIIFETMPDAAAYTQGPQTEQCDTGAFTDYNAVMDFRITIYAASDPSSALAQVDEVTSPPFDPSETLEFVADAAGEYLVQVEGVSSDFNFDTNMTDIQKYKADLTISEPPFLGPTLAVDALDTTPPASFSSVSATVDPRQDTLAGAPVLFSRTQPSGPFAAEPMTQSMPMTFTGELPPASCDEVLQYYIAVEGEVVGEVTFPPEGPSSPISVDLGEPVLVLEDDFETQIGWTVEGTITSTLNGRWERGVPQGDGSRGDPPQDFDGSGQCYITGNTGSGVNSDVDGGESILVSPAFDLSGTTDPILSYARWYDNTGSGFGSGQGEDTLKIDVTDGVTTIEGDTVWYPLEIVGPDSPESTGGWFDAEFRLSEALADLVDSGEFDLSTTQFQVRFIADDLINSSVVEAGVDAVAIGDFVCVDPESCTGDLNGDGQIDFSDVNLFTSAFQSGDPVADLSGDGSVGFEDLNLFIQGFTEGCDATPANGE